VDRPRVSRLLLSSYFYYKTGCQVLFAEPRTRGMEFQRRQCRLSGVPLLEKREKWGTPKLIRSTFREKPRYTPHVDVPTLREENLSPVSTLRVTSPLISGHAAKRGGLDFRVYQDLKIGMHRELLNHVDLEKVATQSDDHTRRQVYAVIQELASNLKTPVGAPELRGPERERLSLEVLKEVFGLGPLEPLLQDPTISDILVNGAREVYIERAGVLEEFGIIFKDTAHLMRIIEKIVSAVGRRVDESSPMVDARLADGSRVNVILPPLAIDGPHLSIRRFGHVPISEQDLLASQTLTQPMMELLRAAVKARLNIVVSGGTGAGKTTLLNVLSGYISEKERIVTIEDSAELHLKQRHVVRLECRPADAEGNGAIMQRQLVVNSLRMRPNRIIVGEVRSEEALDMLQAMNTGHDGSLTTVHANSPRDAIARLETMVMMGNLNMPEKAIRRQIASAITLVLQVARFNDGSRRLTHITEITGMESDIVSMQDVFLFEKQGVSSEGRTLGTFTATGIRPRFEEKIRASGISLPAHFFEPTVKYRRR
jgi:pilus assembly protein CpaF